MSATALQEPGESIGAGLRLRLAGFVRTLRDNGFRVGLAETRDGLAILASPLALQSSSLKQALRAASDGDAAGRAATLLRYTIGCLHQYAKSGFTKKPTESFSAQRRYLLA